MHEYIIAYMPKLLQLGPPCVLIILGTNYSYNIKST